MYRAGCFTLVAVSPSLVPDTQPNPVAHNRHINDTALRKSANFKIFISSQNTTAGQISPITCSNIKNAVNPLHDYKFTVK